MTKRLLALVLAFLLLTGCAGRPGWQETEFFAMDTVMKLRLYGGEEPTEVFGTVIRSVSALENILSVTKEQSAVARLNRGEAVTPSEDLRILLEKSIALSERTNGCLDPTIYPLVKLWGFTTGEYRVPEEAEVQNALKTIGSQYISFENDMISLENGAQLDFGAVAKGYAAEVCADLIREAGCSGILTLGGNIQTVGEKPDGSDWRIGITDPEQPDASIAALSLRGSHAVVTSGGYQRYFEENGVRYSHIIDPSTGYPTQKGLSSVTVVADSGFLADGLSTALYVMGLEEATEFWRESEDFEMVLITQEGEIHVSEGLSGHFSCEKEYQVIKK